MQIHPQIEKDSHFLADLSLSQVRLMPDGENPWFILIPRLPNMKDWCDLDSEQQHELNDEINLLCELLKAKVSPDKLNIASLGNMVPQLHIHVIARYQNDRAWPATIWGTDSTKKFDPKMVDFWKDALSSADLN